MTANYILIIVIGLFLIITGVIYLIHIKGNKEASRREKVVSLILVVIGFLVVIYPVFKVMDFNGSKSGSGQSHLLGAEFYNRPIQQDPSSYQKSAELYKKAVGKWNVEKTGFDSAEVAIDELDRSIALYETAEAYTARGQIKVQLSLFESAIKDYNRAIELNSKFGNAYFNRAAVFYIMGNNAGACDDWKVANGLGVPNTEETIKMLCN